MTSFNPWGSELPEYGKLFSEFGMSRLEGPKFESLMPKHRLFRRGLIFAHRDLDKFVDANRQKKQIAVMSGIKPSSEFHLGSKMTAEELIFFQKEFGAKVFYCIADLEANADNGISLEESHNTAVSNVADLLALGLDAKNAYIYKQSQERRVTNMAFVLAKRVTPATLRAIYGEREMALYMSALIQVGDILLPQHEEFGGQKQVLVPIGADQDPHIRLTRDIAVKLGLIPPAATYHKFMRALNGEEKMSKRDPMGVLNLSDTIEVAKKKIMGTFTGGRTTAEEQKRLGGMIDKCVIYDLAVFHFLEKDEELLEMKRRCLKGEILCGADKSWLWERIEAYLVKHQGKREKMLPKAEKILEGGN